MTIEQTNVVDFVAFDDAGKNVFLIVVDHLVWDENEGEHLLLLQDKLNTYIEFVEGGQLYTEFPKAAGREITLRVAGSYPLSKQAERFFGLAGERMREVDIQLFFELQEST